MPDATTPPGQERTLRVLQTGLNLFESGSGGLDRVYADLLHNLPACGIDVRGIVVGPPDAAARSGGRVGTFAQAGDSRVRRLGSARRALGDAVASGEFDLLASHFPLHAAMALDRLRALPVVMHFHGPWASESRFEGQNRAVTTAKHLLERLAYRRASRVIVLSAAFGRLLHARYGVPEERIHIVPGSVELERFDIAASREEARRRLGWPLDRPILLSVRRLTERMGLDRLIAAMAVIARRRPEAMLYVAGRGRLQAAFTAQIAEAGLQDHVRLLGFLPEADLPLAYRAATLNVVPTIALEGFGLTAAEALAAGTPSMVTPVGGLPEVVAALSPDLVFASTATDALAGGLLAALEGRLTLPDAAACRAYAAARFDPLLAARRTAAIYRSAAA